MTFDSQRLGNPANPPKKLFFFFWQRLHTISMGKNRTVPDIYSFRE